MLSGKTLRGFFRELLVITGRVKVTDTAALVFDLNKNGFQLSISYGEDEKSNQVDAEAGSDIDAEGPAPQNHENREAD